MNIKKETKDEEKIGFFDGFFEEFQKYPFGSMAKRDLECLIFSLMEKINLIEGTNNRDKAYNLGINATRLNSYIVDANVKFEKKANENESAQMILDKLKNKNVTYEDSYFIFVEENPVFREDFIQAMKNKGFFTDTSHNKEIIKVKAIALLDFLTDSSDVSVLKELIDKADFNDDKLKNYFINQKNWKDIGKDLLGHLKDSEGDALKLLTTTAQYSFDFVKAKKNKIK